MSRRAVITGIGVAAPSGMGVDAHWKTVIAGESRIGRITLFDPARYPTTLAGEVADLAVEDHVPSKVAAQTDRWTWLGFAAAGEALADAGIDPAALEPYSMAATLASSSGGNLFGQKELQRLWSKPARTVGAYQSIAWFYAASVGQLSIHHQLKGPSSVLCAEAAGGLDSLAHAARTVRRGTPVVLAGGTECPLSPYALACQQRSGWLTERTDPLGAYLPFDADADGYVPAEGGAVFVVEDLDHALARGAEVIYGEVAGWGATHDGASTVRGGAGSAEHYAAALRRAVERAGLAPSEVDALFPDALAVPGYDASEAAAIRAALGPAVPVTTQKSLVGRLYQGGSALDVATALLAMRRGLLPATTGLRTPAPGCADLNFVREPRTGPIGAAVVGARGFDGFNSALAIRAYRPEET